MLKQDVCSPCDSGVNVYIGLEHIESGRFFVRSFGKPDQVVSSKNRFAINDILYGKLRPYLDKAAVMEVDGICSTDILVFTPKNKIPPIYIVALLHTDQFIQYAKQTTNGVNHPRTSWASLREFPIQIPPMLEKQKIAAVLFKTQKAIELQESIIELTRELKKSTLHRVFTNGLRGEKLKETEIGQIPKSWEVVRLGEFTSVITKGSSPKWQGFDYCREGVPFIRSQNVGDGTLLLDEIAYLPISFNEKEKRSIIHTGDLLINLVGASIGRVAIADERVNGANMNQAVAIVRFKDSSLLSWFVMNYLLTTRGQEEISFNKKEIARANISLSDINGFVIPKPMEKEQEQIVQIFRTIDEKIELHTANKSTLQDLFKTMLNKLMTGKIRVKDLGIDVSEVET